MVHSRLILLSIQNAIEFSWNQSIELASALAYLHDAGIVHGDVKGDNIIISDNGRAQLGDFGSSILLNYSSLSFTQTGFKGTQRFMAPELLDQSSDKHTIKSDIYALGMTLLQIMTGKLPYAGQPDYTVPHEVLVKRSRPGRPDFNGILAGQTAKDELWCLLNQCWTYEPESRPTAMEVKETLVELNRISSDR
ncbi:unnamed protein product [Rhizoctonia solani]|uniref:mitogen-activated protein kinase kinase n=1 Tax=Rhizoctonia solani TaxID=456999 RepID=A0A8H3HTD3_9AGAM|nr:unnamed protein product [Rhizoctonia solani]